MTYEFVLAQHSLEMFRLLSVAHKVSKPFPKVMHVTSINYSQTAWESFKNITFHNNHVCHEFQSREKRNHRYMRHILEKDFLPCQCIYIDIGVRLPL